MLIEERTRSPTSKLRRSSFCFLAVPWLEAIPASLMSSVPWVATAAWIGARAALREGVERHLRGTRLPRPGATTEARWLESTLFCIFSIIYSFRECFRLCQAGSRFAKNPHPKPDFL